MTYNASAAYKNGGAVRSAASLTRKSALEAVTEGRFLPPPSGAPLQSPPPPGGRFDADHWPAPPARDRPRCARRARRRRGRWRCGGRRRRRRRRAVRRRQLRRTQSRAARCWSARAWACRLRRGARCAGHSSACRPGRGLGRAPGSGRRCGAVTRSASCSKMDFGSPRPARPGETGALSARAVTRRAAAAPDGGCRPSSGDGAVLGVGAGAEVEGGGGGGGGRNSRSARRRRWNSPSGRRQGAGAAAGARRRRGRRRSRRRRPRRRRQNSRSARRRGGRRRGTWSAGRGGPGVREERFRCGRGRRRRRGGQAARPARGKDKEGTASPARPATRRRPVLFAATRRAPRRRARRRHGDQRPAAGDAAASAGALGDGAGQATGDGGAGGTTGRAAAACSRWYAARISAMLGAGAGAGEGGEEQRRERCRPSPRSRTRWPAPATAGPKRPAASATAPPRTDTTATGRLAWAPRAMRRCRGAAPSARRPRRGPPESDAGAGAGRGAAGGGGNLSAVRAGGRVLRRRQRRQASSARQAGAPPRCAARACGDRNSRLQARHTHDAIVFAASRGGTYAFGEGAGGGRDSQAASSLASPDADAAGPGAVDGRRQARGGRARGPRHHAHATMQRPAARKPQRVRFPRRRRRRRP